VSACTYCVSSFMWTAVLSCINSTTTEVSHSYYSLCWLSDMHYISQVTLNYFTISST